MSTLDKIYAYGHLLIKCVHNTTIEITKENFLTEKGTCILGINSSKACYDINKALREKIKNGNAIKVIIKIDKLYDTFIGYGDRRLTLKSKLNMVFRKSNYICDRTILINCTKASQNLNRNLIEKLKNPNKKFSISFQEIGSVETK